MISRAYRFHGHNSLNFVYRNGQTIRTDYVTLRHVPSKNPDYRLAIVVSKKVSKSAVIRNRIRRRLYESVRLIKKSVDQPWPKDMVLTVYDEGLAKIPADELHNLVVHLFQKAKII